jgi:spore coat protein U-like protein
VLRLTLVLAAVAVGLALAYGAAASLGISSAKLGAGGASVARCDTSFTRTLNLGSGADVGKVVSVTIGDVHSACSGGQMTVVLTDASGAKVGDGGPVTVSDSSVNVSIDEKPAVGTVRNVHVVVVGP